MTIDFKEGLRRYAALAIGIGVGLRPGQRLMITDPRRAGIPLEIAPFVRQLVVQAYQAGARLVDVIWRDDAIQRIRFEEAPRDSFEEWPEWQAKGLLEHFEHGGALISVLAANPDLLNDQDPGLVTTVQKTAWAQYLPTSEYTSRDRVNWLVISASYPGWALKVFPDLPPAKAEAELWQALFRVCRVDQPDPIAAWKEHIRQLVGRSDYLNHKQYRRLRYTGPGTQLTVGLPSGHRWKAARSKTPSGIEFTANVPTEEVFTLPNAVEVDGEVTATRPLNYGDALIDGFHVRFQKGRAVEASAKRGEAVLRKMLETDDGARRLGEVALVPHSSPISQSGLMFYNTLLDENCASHLAFGRAYKFSLQGGEKMSDEEFQAAGGNHSLIHVDFMVGSGEIDIDGITADGKAEPVMRQGEWAFDV
jgi:aminopeptidase